MLMFVMSVVIIRDDRNLRKCRKKINVGFFGVGVYYMCGEWIGQIEGKELLWDQRRYEFKGDRDFCCVVF